MATGATVAQTPASGGITRQFTTSFESGEAPALWNTTLEEPVNVSVKTKLAPGSLLGRVQGVTASAENPAEEGVSKLLDDSPQSKWLAPASSATVVYRLDSAQALVKYSLTSANDAPGRDPKDFTIEGSSDGSKWTTVDTRSGESFGRRGLTKTYVVTNPGSFSRYRLNVSANVGGDASIQLADWGIFDGSTDQRPTSPMLTVTDFGPTAGLNSKAGAGFSGQRALRYGGLHVADGPASATNVLFGDLSLKIGKNTQLSYKIFPELGRDLKYPATFAAIDLLLEDSTRVSSASYKLAAGHGGGISATEQGASKILFADEWNSVKIDLGSLVGRTVSKVLLRYDNPTGAAETAFQGWVDDVSVADAPKAIDASRLVNYVDTRRGTNSSSAFSRGNNIPAATVPNGFNFWTPMTNASSQTWLYSYASANNFNNLPTLQGIGVSHEPSPWMGDRNQLAILPALTPADGAAPNATLDARALEFSHLDETARPHVYSVKFSNGMSAMVAPTDHAAVMSFTFPGKSGSVLVDQVDGASALTISSDGKVAGWVEGGTGLSVGASRMYISGAFNVKPTKVGKAAGDRGGARYATFDTSKDNKVELRLATSFISLDQAAKNLDLEVTGKSFEAVRAAAAKAWQVRLGVVTLTGAKVDQLATMYGNLYRLNMYPNSQFENTGTATKPVFQYASPVSAKVGKATDTQTNAVVKSGKIYVNNGFWDTYRTTWPAYAMLYPTFAGELMDGFVQQYKDAGWIARWSSPGYADLMTGTSSDVAFADAYLKGVATTDALSAYDAAVKNATVLPTSVGVGRKGLETSIFLGYTPNATHESVSWALEGYINDYGISQMGAKLSIDLSIPEARRSQIAEESKYFADRAKHYVALFDPSIDFFQAKNADGSFQTPAEKYDPQAWGGAYTETNGWNFAFHAPFDVAGLAALYGGSDKLVAKLDTFFATPEKADKPGGYGTTIHEMLEARSVRMGQLGMSNQPSHHIPYIYAAAGAPSKTQAAVREITRRLYVGSDIGQGYIGDEDNGESSSWYIFSALGFYPMAMASNTYTIGSPLFTRAVLAPIGGKKLTIEAPGNSVSNVYVSSATFGVDSKTQVDLTSSSLSATSIAAGGILTFKMSDKPSSWAATAPAAVAVPAQLKDATKSGSSAMSAADGTDLSALTDDNSTTTVKFSNSKPVISMVSSKGAVTVKRYTITNAASGDVPTIWKLEGSSDGTTWMTLDQRSAQSWRWQTQTRSFDVLAPAAYTNYRLSVVTSSNSNAPTLAELELLTQ